MLFSFHRRVASLVIAAVLFHTVAPLGVCWCEGCYCENSITQFLPDSESVPSCCECQKAKLPEEPPVDKCCTCGQSESTCFCGNNQKDIATVPGTVSPVKKLNPGSFPKSALVSVSPFDPSDALCSASFLVAQQALLRPHVPLHVMLCVFLN